MYKHKYLGITYKKQVEMNWKHYRLLRKYEIYISSTAGQQAGEQHQGR